MEHRLVSQPAVKMNETAKEEFKKHRKQQLALKKKRQFELAEIEENKRQEDQMLFSKTYVDGASDDKLKLLVKKLQQMYSQS